MQSEFGDLSARLFAAALAMLEDTTIVAAAGLPSKLRSDVRLSRAGRLHRRASEIAAVAHAALIIAKADAATGKRRKHKSRQSHWTLVANEALLRLRIGGRFRPDALTGLARRGLG